MERKRRISAPFLRTGLNNYRQSKTAAQPENTIIALIQAGIADNIFSPIIIWRPEPPDFSTGTGIPFTTGMRLTGKDC